MRNMFFLLFTLLPIIMVQWRMGVSPIGSLPFNSPTIFRFHELQGVAVWQEKITSTITTVDGVKKSVEVGSFSHLCTTVLSICIYIYIYTSHVVATANNSEPSSQHGSMEPKATTRKSSVPRFLPVASWDSKCHLAPLSAPSSPRQTQEFFDKKNGRRFVTQISKNRFFQ